MATCTTTTTCRTRTTSEIQIAGPNTYISRGSPHSLSGTSEDIGAGLCYTVPTNFGVVEHGSIYRSGYPAPENFAFLASYLGIKTIITLVPEPILEEYKNFMRANKITHVQIDVPANKDGKVNILRETMDEVLTTVLSHNHEPVLIHCNRGKHRTGCTVACLRKAQSHSMHEIIQEYTAFAAPKVRLDDLRFVESYNATRFASMVERQRWASSPLPFVAVDAHEQQSVTPALKAL